jgi:anti-sigma regulatory factor (Ser/Thr protein kinase)
MDRRLSRLYDGPADVSTRVETAFQLRRADHLDLRAEPSAASYGRLFVRAMCAHWRLDGERINIAELLLSELVSNAINATAIIEANLASGEGDGEKAVIGIRLLLFERSVVIEVWDASPLSPRLVEPTLEQEHGRGLHIVDALSTAWGYYDASIGGKVVWCEISLVPDAADTPTGGWPRDPAALPRVLQALQALTWDEPA